MNIDIGTSAEKHVSHCTPNNQDLEGQFYLFILEEQRALLVDIRKWFKLF